MQRFVISIVALVIFFSYTSAQLVSASVDASHVGFVDSSIWFDREPFFAGDVVRVYTTLANSSNRDFKGVVTFYDGDASFGSSEVTLERNGGFQVLWADWTPQTGEQRIGVGITEAVLTAQDGTSETVTYQKNEKTLARFIDRDTDSDGIGDREDTDDDNDGIPDSEDAEPLVKKSNDTEGTAQGDLRGNLEDKSTEVVTKIGEIASSTTPKIIAGVEKTFTALEDFRTTQSDAIYRKLKEVQNTLVENDIAVGSSSPEVEKGKKSGPFDHIQLLALTTAGYTLSHKIAFYLAGLFLLYIVCSKVIPFIYRLVRGRSDI
ncbi:MAG: thrombospondin type 3 repeat-containing protein [Candidatus Paceibacterota bacterium]